MGVGRLDGILTLQEEMEYLRLIGGFTNVLRMK
jgi:hypothetical protein